MTKTSTSKEIPHSGSKRSMGGVYNTYLLPFIVLTMLLMVISHFAGLQLT